MQAGPSPRRPRILAGGEPCRVSIVRGQPLGMRNPEGQELYALLLTVRVAGRSPYLIEVGDAVPPAAVPLVFRGNDLPARRIPDGDDRDLAIDWPATLAEVGITDPVGVETADP